MNDIIKPESSSLVALIKNQTGGDLILPKPFEQEIFLFKTYIAGSYYVEGIINQSKNLNLDEEVDFFREPDNKYDKRAIVVKTKSGKKLGYIPRKDNPVFARLMDAGKLLVGKLDEINIKPNDVDLRIRIYLKE